MLNAVERARCLVVLIGKNTHNSPWVKKEVQHAISNGVPVIPIIIGGTLDDWNEISELLQIQAINGENDEWNRLVEKVANSLPSVFH